METLKAKKNLPIEGRNYEVLGFFETGEESESTSTAEVMNANFGREDGEHFLNIGGLFIFNLFIASRCLEPCVLKA
ncbi:MAG: hypothetical protein GF349_04480 [Candidatus Magasanikbacteria bacterium]|nr:hypothetical protein [Candidatus Magasanikbacteria bacterium]